MLYNDGAFESLMVLIGLIGLAVLFSCFMSKLLSGSVRVSNIDE